jgi:hypothetical protein
MAKSLIVVIGCTGFDNLFVLLFCVVLCCFMLLLFYVVLLYVNSETYNLYLCIKKNFC